MIKIDSLHKATPTPLKKSPDVISSINRQEVNELHVHQDRIEGDEVFNKIHHGGMQRVLHHYPFEHHEYWGKIYPGSSFNAGSMGENISSLGLLEKNVCIGDIYEIGSLLCQITEPRKPCATINHQYQIKGIARKVQEEARTGWFYKILRSGTLRKGDKMTLLERPFPDLTVEKCVLGLLVKPNKEIIQLIANNPAISINWKKPANEYLAKGILPDDKIRLGEN